MALKFLKRFFLACVLFVSFVSGTVVCCCALACWTPKFYVAALAAPADKSDTEAAMEELETIVGSLEWFLRLDAVNRQKLQALPSQTLATLEANQQEMMGRLPIASKRMHGLPDMTQDTIAISLTQRHLNAFLATELDTTGGELRHPHISLQDDIIRFAATWVTPAAEVVLSCDFELAKTKQAHLTFELHAVRVGKLPLPAMLILKQYMRTNPVLPEGLELNVDGERPTLLITKMPDDGKIQLENLLVADHEIRLMLRRTSNTVVVAE